MSSTPLHRGARRARARSWSRSRTGLTISRHTRVDRGSAAVMAGRQSGCPSRIEALREYAAACGVLGCGPQPNTRRFQCTSKRCSSPSPSSRSFSRRGDRDGGGQRDARFEEAQSGGAGGGVRTAPGRHRREAKQQTSSSTSVSATRASRRSGSYFQLSAPMTHQNQAPFPGAFVAAPTRRSPRPNRAPVDRHRRSQERAEPRQPLQPDRVH